MKDKMNGKQFELLKSEASADEYPKLLFEYDKVFPSKWKRFWWKVDNFTFNQIYPLPRWLVSLLFAAATLGSAFRLNHRAWPQRWPALGVGLLAAFLPVLISRQFLFWFLFRYKRQQWENPKKPSLPTKLWRIGYVLWKRFAPQARLATCNSLLPGQPVPSLEESVQKYLESMRPLCDEAQFQKLHSDADTFLHTVGPKLQTAAKYLSWRQDNYITPFWNKYAYLSSRAGLLINTSVASIDTIQRPPGATQCSRAAHCAFLLAVSAMRIEKQRFRPPADGFMNTESYFRVYGNCRIALEGCDEWRPTGLQPHFIVMANGCFYRLDAFDPKTGRLRTADELFELLTEISQRRENPTDAERHLAALTTDNRDQWARNRERFFLSSPRNRQFLQQIENSISVLVLDSDDYGYREGEASTVENLMRAMLLGNGANRWADKPLHYAFGPNGEVGATSEHSVADGLEFVHLMENCLGVDRQCLSYDHHPKNPQLRPSLEPSTRLELEIVDGMSDEVERCLADYRRQMSNVQNRSLVFDAFGKSRIKKAGCSPDAFMQMALQLAQFRCRGEFVLTYEAGAARFFRNARTETIRSLSNESRQFVEAMQADLPNAEKCRLLKTACERHQKATKLAVSGGGVDRHLFVLMVLAKGMGLESEFLNGYAAQDWKLSTSQSPYVENTMNEDSGDPVNSWMGGGFCAVATDGYGCCYRFVGNHSIYAHISAYHNAESTDAERFRSELDRALKEMMAMMEAN